MATNKNNYLIVFLLIVNIALLLLMLSRQDAIVDTLTPVVSVANVDKYNREAWLYEMRAEYRITQEEIITLRELIEDNLYGNSLTVKVGDKNDGY